MTYPGVYIEEAAPGGRSIAGVPTSTTAFLGRAVNGPVNDPVTITSFADFELSFGGLALACPMSYAVRDFFLNGGIRAVIVRLAGADGGALDQASYVGSRADGSGLFALEKTDFNLLCVPPDTRAGTTPAAVYQAALACCESRRAMLIVDPPAHWNTAAAARDWLDADIALAGSAARNAALYFPRLVQADPLRGGELDTFVPCGAVAGVMARTDAQRGVWKAPAGTDATLLGTADLAVTLTDADNGLLNPLGVNCLRTFPGAGHVVWGSRTLRGADRYADEYKYVPVRRLALYLEESLDRGTRWAVFEPNGEPLWSALRLHVGAFMHALFTGGALQGSTPREAYFVKVDRETTTQRDIDLGVVNIVVGFAPLKRAEFVIIRIRHQLAPARPAGNRLRPLILAFNGELLQPVATWREILLPDAELSLLHEVADQAQRAEPGSGISALFTGSRGTGKTMAAEVIANHLGRDVYRVDLSAVVSRHAGETKENLGRLFDAAEGSGAILCFDEADALFGKRTEVRDSHDRYANVESSYLLERMEAYGGLSILATREKAAIDEAFTRRLRYVIAFPAFGLPL